MKHLFKLTTLLLVLLSITLTAHAERRALVIGNSAYGGDRTLPRATADAAAVAQALQDVGFAKRNITTVNDLANVAMSDTIDQFTKSIGTGDEVVFYFSGHGFSTDNGGNFLVPIGAPVQDLEASDLSFVKNFQSLQLTLDALQAKKPKVLIAILDACRSYPTRQLSRKTGSNSVTGLNTHMQAAEGQLIMYAASHGRSAYEAIDPQTDKHPLSIYTRVLVEEMRKPTEHIVNMAQRVQDRVAQMTAQTPNRAQRPEFQSKLYGGYALVRQSAVQVATALPPTPSQPQVSIVLPAPVVVASPQVIDGFEILDDPVLGKGSLAKDLKTGLVWQRCSVGQRWDGSTCAGDAKNFAFNAAQKLAVNGWRVPTIRELSSLIYCSSDKTKNNADSKDDSALILSHCDGSYVWPTIRNRTFPKTLPFYWSSSYVGNPSAAWYVSFSFGRVSHDIDDNITRTSNVNVRLVQ